MLHAENWEEPGDEVKWPMTPALSLDHWAITFRVHLWWSNHYTIPVSISLLSVIYFLHTHTAMFQVVLAIREESRDVPSENRELQVANFVGPTLVDLRLYEWMEKHGGMVRAMWQNQGRNKSTTYMNKNAESSFLFLWILHSKIQRWFSRVNPWDPHTKLVWLWLVIKTTMLTLVNLWRSHSFKLQRNKYMGVMTLMTHIDTHWYAKSHVVILYLLYDKIKFTIGTLDFNNCNCRKSLVVLLRVKVLLL